jgi:cytidylate kinase
MRELLGTGASTSEPGPSGGGPVIAISRDPGAGGRELAHALGKQFGLQVYDREIIHRIAQSTHVTEQTVSFLDERPRPLLTDWMSSVEPGEAYLSPYAYYQHLVNVAKAIARHGSAVLLGRGVHLILGPGQGLRVLVTAPHADRVRRVASRENIDLHEARRLIARAEAERRAFLAKYFRVHAIDPASFDLVLNTTTLGLAGCVEVVQAAMGQMGHSQPVARTG